MLDIILQYQLTVVIPSWVIRGVWVPFSLVPVVSGVCDQIFEMPFGIATGKAKASTSTS